MATDQRRDRGLGAAPPWAATGARASVARWLGLGPAKFFAGNGGASLLTTLVVGGSVFGLYRLQSMQDLPAVMEGPRIFDRRPAEPSSARPVEQQYQQTAPDGSLGYVAQANRGAIAPENAGDAAQGQAAADAQAPDAGAQPNNEHAANTSSAFLKKLTLDTSKWNSGGGGSLAGGPGLSGGIGRSFAPINGSSSLSGRAQAGKLSGSAASIRGAASRAALGRGAAIKGKGVLASLSKASSISKSATKFSSAEGQSYTASQAFGGGSAGGGSALTGTGGTGLGGTGLGVGSSPNAGPLDTKGDQNQAPPSGPTMAVPNWVSKAADMARALLMVAAAIIVVIGILAKIKYAAMGVPGEAETITAFQMTLLKIAFFMALGVMTMGATLMAQGQAAQGATLMTAAGIVAAAAAVSLWGGPYESSWMIWLLILGGVAGIGMSVLSKTAASGLNIPK